MPRLSQIVHLCPLNLTGCGQGDGVFVDVHECGWRSFRVERGGDAGIACAYG